MELRGQKQENAEKEKWKASKDRVAAKTKQMFDRR